MADPIQTGSPGAGHELSPPPVLAGYLLLRCIGRGSYGDVWLARDVLGVFRAVKVVYRKTFEHDRPFERELSGIQKFEPVSRTHPSQVSILEVGRNRQAGYFYYVMELADGVGEEAGEKVGRRESESGVSEPSTTFPPSHLPTFSPATYLPRTLKLEIQRRRRLPFHACLDITLALTTALDHLHQHGLIHRDIKPSNVIFVRGVPKLADIGLVTDVGATVSHVGTEGFLPPEGPGTPQADIYSLGKVLYEMSTGRDRLEFPELPTLVEETEEKEYLLELNQVFLKACQNDVTRRYQSAREMFSDLALLQSGKSLRRARALEQHLARARRVATVAVSIALVAATTTYFIQQRRVQKERQKTALEELKKIIAQTAETNTRHRLSDLYVANGEALEREGDLPGALLWFGTALEQDPPTPDRTTEHRRRIGSLLARCPQSTAIFAHQAAVNLAQLSVDGRLLMTASEDGTARLWNSDTGDPVGQALRHMAPVQWAALSADGARAVTLAGGMVQIWSGVEREGFARKLDYSGKFTGARLSPDGRQVLTFTDTNNALLWEAGAGRLRFTFSQAGPIGCAAFSPDGRCVATAGADRGVQLWSTETGAAISPLMAHDGVVIDLHFSADSRRLVTVEGVQARLWDARSGEPAAFPLRHEATVHTARFSPDGKWLVSASEDYTARLWDARSGKVAATLRHAAPVQLAEFSPDGSRIVTISGNRVQLWNFISGAALPPLFLAGGPVRDVHFSTDGERLAIASADGAVRLVRMEPEQWHWWPGMESEGVSWWQLLAGRQILATGRMEFFKPEVLRALWQSLKLKSPRDFAPMGLTAWHQRAGERAENAGAWPPALFHWERALAISPADTTWSAHRDHARSELARFETALARAPGVNDRFPARSAGLRSELIDLSKHYNAMLTEQWLPTNVVAAGNDLASLPRGVQRLNGIDFDVRGLIQLDGGALENSGGRFPRTVDAIRVGRKTGRLHFLQGAAWSTLAGTPIGAYRVHFANGQSREIKIIFGQNIGEWWGPATLPPLTLGAAMAWEGSNAATRGLGLRLRIYQMTWINPWPEEEIAAIDFTSTLEKPAPFLISITAD